MQLSNIGGHTMKVSQQELNQHKEQLKSYLQQIIYAHDQKSLELSIPFGKSMEAERYGNCSDLRK